MRFVLKLLRNLFVRSWAQSPLSGAPGAGRGGGTGRLGICREPSIAMETLRELPSSLQIV
jgi:hypothetical protein